MANSQGVFQKKSVKFLTYFTKLINTGLNLTVFRCFNKHKPQTNSYYTKPGGGGSPKKKKNLAPTAICVAVNFGEWQKGKSNLYASIPPPYYIASPKMNGASI